jgi:hypothetical protein
MALAPKSCRDDVMSRIGSNDGVRISQIQEETIFQSSTAKQTSLLRTKCQVPLQYSIAPRNSRPVKL